MEKKKKSKSFKCTAAELISLDDVIKSVETLGITEDEIRGAIVTLSKQPKKNFKFKGGNNDGYE